MKTIKEFLPSNYDAKGIEKMESFLIQNEYYYTVNDACGNLLYYIFSIDTIDSDALEELRISAEPEDDIYYRSIARLLELMQALNVSSVIIEEPKNDKLLKDAEDWELWLELTRRNTYLVGQFYDIDTIMQESDLTEQEAEEFLKEFGGARTDYMDDEVHDMLLNDIDRFKMNKKKTKTP
jgi:hypothetical protein